MYDGGIISVCLHTQFSGKFIPILGHYSEQAYISYFNLEVGPVINKCIIMVFLRHVHVPHVHTHLPHVYIHVSHVHIHVYTSKHVPRIVLFQNTYIATLVRAGCVDV